MKRLLSISGCTFLLAAFAAEGQDLRSVPYRRLGVIADAIGTANIAAGDITGDGIADLISCSQGAPFAVRSTGGSKFATVWHGPAVGCKAVAVGDRNGDGAPEVIVTTASSSGAGSLMVFDPRSLGGPLASVVLPGSVAGVDVAMGDVDADGLPEIVVTTSAATHVFDAATLALQWTASGNGGTELALGEIDGDGKLDIVVNGSTGYVLDAVTQTLKWGYLGGFGRCMVTGDVDNDNKAEIVFANYSTTITILNGDTFTTTTVGTYYPDSIAVGDADNDGAKEIITGNSGWGNIIGYNPSTGAQLWFINNPEYSTPGVIVADVDGGNREVIWGAGLNSSGKDVLYAGNANTHSIKCQSVDLDGPFASVVGDLDGDGRLEIVIATRSSDSGYTSGIVEVFDLATWTSKGVFANNGLFVSVSRLAIGQMDGDAAKEVIGIGSYSSAPQIFSWDGVTRAMEFSSAVPPCCSSPSFISSTLVVANVDGDAVDEIMVGESDAKVIVLNGASNVIQTSFSTTGTPVDLSLADLNANGVTDLVIGTNSGVYVRDTANWVQQGGVALSGVQRVAANAAAGTVAVSFTSGGTQQLKTFTGIDLTPSWTCSGLGTVSIGGLEIATISGAQRVIAGNNSGLLRLFPLGGVDCPAFTSTTLSATQIVNLRAVEVTGDSRPELEVDTYYSSELHLIGLSSDVRGDVTGDGLITNADIAAVTAYVYGAAPGINPSADANADQRVGVEDIIQLIHYYYEGGPAPPP